MKLHRLFLLALIAIVACLTVAPSASQAQTAITVTANPDRFQAAVNRPTAITVTWQINRASPPAPGSSSSPNAQISVGGMLIGNIGGAVSRSFAGVAPTEIASITETLMIPQAAAFRAVRSGAPIVLSRTFNDSGGATDTGTATVVPSGPGSQPFSVSRLSLTFDDQSRVKVLPKGSRLRAIAELNTTGSGLFTGQWEIADAATTPGTPVFRPLALVRQAVSGGRRTVITSPPLPTRLEGNHLVRLNLTDPTPFFDEPELQYYVTPESPLPGQQAPGLMLITAPAPGTPLTRTTRFSWQAVPGATAYKLEVFSAAAGPAEIADQSQVTSDVPLDRTPDSENVERLRPLSGVVVPPAITELRLQEHSLAHLPGKRRYLWTVKALGEAGAVIGVSPPREIYKP